MKDFVAWLAGRRYRMVLLAAALAMLPPLGLFGQAVIVLAVLLRGPMEGLIVAAGATALMILPSLFSATAPATLLLFALGSWLPVLGLALLLERSRSLSLTAQVATIVVAIGVIAVFALGAPADTWRAFFDEHASALREQLGALPDGAVAELSRIMTGIVGAMTVIGSMLAVFIGRWWQSILQNPGAFSLEFKGLRMGYITGVMAAAVFLGAGLTPLAIFENLTLVFLTGFLLHGLAVIHAALATLNAGGLWLAAVYALLVVLMPFAELAVAGLGFVDNWFNFRSRLGGRSI